LDFSGRLLRLWDLAVIFRQHMAAAGDVASADKFVLNDVDWCHANSVHYWMSQDTLVVSCRESFVVGIGYADSKIKWLLGHTSKLWYQFPSLRAMALALAPGTEAPIGQHSVSITSAGELLLFDNGLPSLASTNVPAGIPRNVSYLRKYRIDPTRRLASEVWTYSHPGAMYSSVCSSVYQEGSSFLVDYAHVNGPNGFLHLVGLGANNSVAFDFKYAGDCWNAWNAKILRLDNLHFQ
jgi:hypothetical protein